MDLSQGRLLFVITGTSVGGSEKILADLAIAMRPLWAAVGVCSLKPIGRFGHELERRGVPVVSCGMRGGGGARGFLESCRALAPLTRAVRAFRPSLVHAFLFRAGLMVRLPVLLLRVPRLVVSVRTLEDRSRLLHLADGWTAPAVDRFTAVSEAARRQIARRSGIPLRRIDRIPNGVPISVDGRSGATRNGPDFPAWRRARRDEARRRLASLCGPLPGVLLGSVGRLDPIKGHRTLLEAARLEPAGSGVGIVLIGDGARRAGLESLASRPPLAGRVFILGERADAADLLPALDLFVLPSLAEGMSNALLEAMAEGIPAIATRVGGNLEVIEPERSGLLVDPGDAPGMASAIARVLSDPRLAASLGREGRDRVLREFSQPEMVRAYRDLYAGLLASL